MILEKLGTIRDIVLLLVVILFIWDIANLTYANLKTTFGCFCAIVFHPIYFIWRAYLLQKKKLASIIYTICYYGIVLAEFYSVFYLSSNILKDIY